MAANKGTGGCPGLGCGTSPAPLTGCEDLPALVRALIMVRLLNIDVQPTA